MDKGQLNTRFNATWVGGALLLVAAVLAMVWALNRVEFDDWVSSSPKTAPEALQAGQVTNIAHPRSAPLFELSDASGKLLRLESLKGNAVIVHFWASWCPPCLAEIPHWLEFASKWNGRPVRFVAVSLDKSWGEALKILPDSLLSPQVFSVLDHEQKLPDLFGTYQYPETYLLDRRLRIISKWVGAQEWGSPAITQAVEAAIL